MEDKIIEVKVGTIVVDGVRKDVWQITPFEFLKPGMIFRVRNDALYDGKIYKCTSLPIYPSDGQPLIHCDEVVEMMVPRTPKFTI